MSDMQTPTDEGGRADQLGGRIGAEDTKAHADLQRGFYRGPGFKDAGAGKDAAEAFAGKLGRRQAEVLDGLHRLGPATSDEVASAIGRPAHSTRPRVSELVRLGAVVKLEDRRPTAYGSFQHVHRLATPTEQAVFLARENAEAEHGEGGCQ